MDLYGRLLGDVFYPFWEGARKRATIPRLRELERTQWLSLKELEELQFSALTKVLVHAAENVPFYRDRFRDAKIDPREIRTTADLLRLPTFGREETQTFEKELQSTVPPFVKITKRTSGSTGDPFSFGYEQASQDWREAIRLRGYAWAGYRPGVRAFHLWGPGTRATGWKKAKIDLDHKVRRDHYFDCSNRSPERMDVAIEEIRRFKPDVIVCFATAGGELARRVNQTKARSWGDISIISGAEALLPSDRSAMLEAFGPEVFETYGAREVMMMGSECAEHAGLHLTMENTIFEILVRDGDRTRHAEPGEIGEVVVTDLHNYAMPFIRYRNGDRAIAGDRSPCACGRQLLRIKGVEGRVSAIMRDGKGTPVSALFIHTLLAQLPHGFQNFQAVQRKDGAVTLKIVKSPAFDTTAHEAFAEGFRKYLPGVEVASEFVADIPTTRAGKRQIVVCET